VRQRIEFLTGLAQDRIAEKRAALEEHLWSVHEADIGNFFETYDAVSKDNAASDGEVLTVRKQRAKLLSDLPAEHRKLIEDVTVDRRGNVIPRLYSKTQANRGLRDLLNIGRSETPSGNEVSKLSDAELVKQLSDQARELGVQIQLDYAFLGQPKDASEPDVGDAEAPALPNGTEPDSKP
jgi:hypothetical protein